MYSLIQALYGLLLATLSLPGVAFALDQSLPNTLARIKPGIIAVGSVLPTRRPPGAFLGTGFVVADGNHALTNAHVIPKKMNESGKERLAVLTDVGKGKDAVRYAEVIETDPDHDVALVKFSGSPIPALSLGDSSNVREGELYAFTGFPIGMVIGFHPVTHRGVISAITPIAIPQLSSQQLDRQLLKRLSKPYNVFQLDATAYPGNSGSPLYHPETGKVVGLLNMVFVKESKENVLDKPSGISYAIPIEYAKKLLRKAGLKWH